MHFFDLAYRHSKALSFLLLAVSCIPAIFASKGVLTKLKQSSGWKRLLALMELVVLWLLPLLAFISTEASEAQLSPRNQPLAAVSALVKLELGPTDNNFERPKGSSNEYVAQLSIGQSSHFKMSGSQIVGNGAWDVFLCSNNFEKWGNASSTTYFLEFHVVPFSAPINRLTGNAPIEELIRRWDMWMINIWFLPPKTQILRGSITVTMNATTQKAFPIPSQEITEFLVIGGIAPR